MSLCGSKAIARAGSVPPAKLTVVSSSPATTCAAVTTSSGPRNPAAAFDAEPAGRPDDAHDARRRRAHARARENPWVGASVGTGGPAMLGNGSTRLSAFSSVRGGTIAFSRSRMRER